MSSLPFTLSPVGEEEAELRRRVFAGPCSALREGVLVAEPGGVRWGKIGSHGIKFMKSRKFYFFKLRLFMQKIIFNDE